MEPKREFPSFDNLETCQTEARSGARHETQVAALGLSEALRVNRWIWERLVKVRRVNYINRSPSA